MSRLDALLQELCPNGVEFMELGDIGVIFGGLSGKSKADFADGNARFVSYVNVFNNIAVNLEAPDFVRVDPSENQRRLQRGDMLFTGSSETPDDVAMSSVVTQDVNEPLYLNSFCIGFRLHDQNILNPEFAKHLFRSREVRKQLVRTASGVTRFNVSKARLARVAIPVPPAEVQLEIARVLDVLGGSGSSLAAELTAELAARRRQYAYYRELLLSFSTTHDVPWSQLGEIGEFIRGRRFTKRDYVTENGIPAIHYGEIYTHFGTTTDSVRSHVRSDMAKSLRFARPGDVVLTDVGETVDDVGKAVAWVGSTDVAIHDHCYAFRHSMNPAFVSYYMQTNRFRVEKAKYVARTKVKTLLMDGLAKVRIPVPPPAEQERIVKILDNFNALVSDSSGGLGAEIEARRKQYTYYRDRLLTFEEATA